ncbi:MAG: LysM peptidoglycan-binding domain-containing protein [Syntrophobacterales bacterium]|nr:MAG: LysM peptidoglycan-binding domain-containing protein [Syntrophobacterales bacterium]
MRRKRGMRNSVVLGIALSLIGCSNILQIHKGAVDHEHTRESPASPRETSLDPGKISSIPTDEMREFPQVAGFHLSDQTIEGEEGREQEPIVGMSGPPLDYETLDLSEPDVSPPGEGACLGEGEVWGGSGFTEEEEEVGLRDRAPPQEETVAGGPEFDIPIVINGKVEQFIKYYQTKGRKVFSRWLARSRRYFPLMRKLLRERGLSEDLVYMTLIESGCNPRAHSRKKAMGLWQFRYHTGKRYGLRVDWWIDERRDPVKSTIAAARHLKYLYDRFESWYLATAGYNAGEGKILRAIKRYKTEDFWELTKYSYLKRETKNFIPKIIAATLIAKDPEAYGFSDISYEEPIRYEMVRVADATDLRVIAEASESTYKELKRLNPELRRWCTPPDYPDYELKLPYGKREIFLRNFSKIPPSERITFRRHVVRYGETLSHIALRYRTNIGAIMRMNHIKKKHRIRAGQSLIIPTRGSGKYVGWKMREGLHKERGLFIREEKAFIYTVREGDTLWEISRSAGIDLENLCRWNGIQNPSRIYPGDRLKIPTEARTIPAGNEGKIPAVNPEG